MDKDGLGRALTWIAVVAIAIYTPAMVLLPKLTAENVKKESVEIYINGLAALGTCLAVIVALVTASAPLRRQEREARIKARVVAIHRLPAVNEVLRAMGRLLEAVSQGHTPEEVVVRLCAAFDALPPNALYAVSDDDVLAMTAVLPNAGWNIGRSIAIVLVIQDEARGIRRRNYIENAMRLSGSGDTPPERWRAAIDECMRNLNNERVQMEALAKWRPGDYRFD